MIEQLNGFGYEQLYAFDCETYQPEVDAKLAVTE